MPSPTSSPVSSIPSLSPHPLLTATQRPIKEGIHAHLLWDLREHPTISAQAVESLGERLPSSVLHEPATYPPQPFLYITCSFPEEWDILVLPSQQLPSPSSSSSRRLSSSSRTTSSSSSSSPKRSNVVIPIVTVSDVLKAIHASALEHLPTSYLESMQEKKRTHVLEAFERRWKTSLNPKPEEALRNGPMRVDSLMAHTLFAGLAVDPTREKACILSLRRPM